MLDRRSTQSGYVPPVTFAELCATGGIPVPTSEDVDTEFGPIAGPATSDPPAPTDPLEAFCDAWGTAGISPAEALLPAR